MMQDLFVKRKKNIESQKERGREGERNKNIGRHDLYSDEKDEEKCNF